MGCPNKGIDNRIIAEIRKRKAMKAQQESAQVAIPEFQYITHLFSGNLTSITDMWIDQSQIETIRRVGDNMWEVILKIKN
jgi:hypothetical protein